MTGRSLLYVLQRVVPFVIFGIVGYVCLGMQFADGPDVLADRVLFDLSVADELRNHFALGPDGDTPLAPTSHVLWQVLVALVGKIVPNLVAAGMLLNAATALVIIWQTIRLAEKLLNHPALVMASGVVVAVSIPVLGNLLNHGPALLGIALALTAIRIHISGILGHRPVLPLSSAFALGAAMLVHVEFVVIWFAMMAHATTVAGSKNSRFSATQALLQGLVGLALFALILWPAVHRNVTTSGLAWPFDQDVPRLIADAEPTGLTDFSAAPKQQGGIARAIGTTLTAAGKLPAVFLLLSVVGIGITIRQSASRGRSRAFLIGAFCFGIVPLLYGLFSMHSGWMAADAVLGSFYPLLVILGLYAAFQVGLTVTPENASIPSAGATICTIIAATLWTVLCLIATTGFAKSNHDALGKTNQSRLAWEQWHSQNVRGAGRLRVVTDRPGWMFYRNAGKVNIDLAGWLAPENMRGCRDEQGYIDTRKFSTMLNNLDPVERPQAMVLWDSNAETFAKRLKSERGGIAEASPAGKTPKIVVFQW